MLSTEKKTSENVAVANVMKYSVWGNRTKNEINGIGTS